MGYLMSPNHTRITGLLETVPATAHVDSWTRNADGKLEPEYAGGSTVHWDDQTPGPYAKQIAVDDDGDQFALSACTYAEGDPEDEDE